MKVLIISHNPITTYQNMGKTLLSLFSSFDKTELCQLYIYPTIPDADICNSYFRITDRDVVKSYMRFGKVNSRIIESHEIDTQRHCLFESEDEKTFLKKNKKTSFTLLCRDALWACSHWYNARLDHWLANERPTCIFLAPGQSRFIYNIALKIAERLQIGIFTYVCDEYYFTNIPESLFGRFRLLLLKKKMKMVMEKSSGIITICDELSAVYHKEFGTQTHTIFTGSTLKAVDEPIAHKEVPGITFMGNIGCNRFVSIAEIGIALDELNAENGTNYRVFLYTAPLSEEVKKVFSAIDSIQYVGYVTGEEFDKVLRNAPILLHTEAFDPASKERVKHSVSTKIADSLSSGNLLFAYGPQDIASMQYLIRHHCAVVATNSEDLKSTLRTMLFGMDYTEIIDNALSTAKMNHTSEKNSKTLWNLLRSESDLGNIE